LLQKSKWVLEFLGTFATRGEGTPSHHEKEGSSFVLLSIVRTFAE